MTAFPLQRLNWIVVIKIILPAKLKIFTIWPFIAKVCKLDLILKKKHKTSSNLSKNTKLAGDNLRV